MCDACFQKFRTVIQLSDQLIHLSDKAEKACTENATFVLCGIIKDSAFKIRNETEHYVEKASQDKI